MARIFIHDEFDPEATAMLQALYSRSASSVAQHVERVRQVGSAKFMESYYVGYGHASIGDCGVTTLFLEDISILAAKAIEDSPLFSGQETSTRYIDFSQQRLHDPVGNEASKAILAAWLEFYLEALEPTQIYLQERFPLPPGQDEKIWLKAIKARAFDILRGFLPAGATTQVAWTTSLRHAHERLLELQLHPLDEVREIAAVCRQQLVEKYPSSFTHKPRPEVEQYLHNLTRTIAYRNDTPGERRGDFFVMGAAPNAELEALFGAEIGERPRGALLPRYVDSLGTYTCRFTLDYGSFRDLQRHRNGLCRLPVLGARLGFNDWYLDNLPPALKDRALALIERQTLAIAALGETVPKETLQYYIAMGFDVSCELVYGLREMVYVTELRASKTVHPTLRRIAKKLHHFLRDTHPKLKLYSDLDEDEFDVRRGTQDIEFAQDRLQGGGATLQR